MGLVQDISLQRIVGLTPSVLGYVEFTPTMMLLKLLVDSV